MAVYPFSNVSEIQHRIGGKAWGLAQLSQKGFPVPDGLILTDQLMDSDWPIINNWWQKLNYRPIAVRSSAAAEDSKTNSFAGQNKSFLNVKSEADLREAIKQCFASKDREASQAYRDFFSTANKAIDKATEKNLLTGMNVVLQEMVAPEYSGVFFSHDPRNQSPNWLLEVVKGLGESLVSGKVTPGKVQGDGQSEKLPGDFTIEDAERVANIGQRVAKAMGYATDMEWAIDADRKVYVLQTRPITTDKKNENSFQQKEFISIELERLEKKYSVDTPWDGQTFSEWSGFPSYFTFSIWKNAFSPHNAFGNALKEIGYKSFSDKPYSPKDSLLERVFGRAYINLDKLSDLYYGPIPYKIALNPRPHTTFSPKKISWTVLKHAPSALLSMIRVAWNLSAKRNLWLEKCSSELNRFKLNSSYPLEIGQYKNRSNQELFDSIKKESWRFSKDYLMWPLLLVTLTESTIQRLHLLLGGLMDRNEVQKTLRDWMGKGLNTATSAMQIAYKEAMQNPSQRAEFLAKFGHRGPGEMDLVNPRWRELDIHAFGSVSNQEKKLPMPAVISVEDEIAALNSFKREVILEEWHFLKKMLELREIWKMELMKPYAGIRYSLQELSTRWKLYDNVHWLRLSEIEALDPNADYSNDKAIESKIIQRKLRFDSFRDYSFPNLITLRQIKNVISGESLSEAKTQYEGEPLSSGIAKGEARVVTDFSKVDLETWPENVILVAETTDPGWTPLFVKSSAIVVQNGGVLSHCAIVAREMGIPAVSGIRGCYKNIKDGDILWVDGNLGRVSIE